MHYIANLPAGATLSAFPLDLLPSLPRKALEALAEALVDHLDQLDGDPDLDGECSEDELSCGPGGAFADDWERLVAGPGCSIADAGEPAFALLAFST